MKNKLIIYFNKYLVIIFSLYQAEQVMTDLIDFSFIVRQKSSHQSCYSYNSRESKQVLKRGWINQVLEGLMKKIDKNYIKTSQKYIFNINNEKLLSQDRFYNPKVKIIGMITLINSLFTLRIQFSDFTNQKIVAKSTYHRALISNYVLQINAQLQHFKIQYNPVSGQFSFVFNIKSQSNQIISISQILQFGLNSYFQQCQAHFFLLSLMEYTSQYTNGYIINVKQSIKCLKKWIMQRKQENKQMMPEMVVYQQNIKSKKNIRQMGNKKNVIENNVQIDQLRKYLCYQGLKNKSQSQIQQFKYEKVLKTFKKYINEKDILNTHVRNKIKYQNLLQIEAQQSKSLEFFFAKYYLLRISKKQELNEYNQFLQNKEQVNVQGKEKQGTHKQESAKRLEEKRKKEENLKKEQRVSFSDKNGGKNYLAKCHYLSRQTAKKELTICQKLCKLESFLFINQYFELKNYNLTKEGYVLVNYYPKRLNFRQFVFRNCTILSFSAKVSIIINLLQIIYTLFLKNKIDNYFPLIAIQNFQITETFYLNFKSLTKVSSFSLYQICNIISLILFYKPIRILKSDFCSNDVVKGDQVSDKQLGPSACVTFIKFYLLQLYSTSNLIRQIHQLRKKKKLPAQYIIQMDDWARTILGNGIEELLVIFSHLWTMVSRGYEQEYKIETKASSQ